LPFLFAGLDMGWFRHIETLALSDSAPSQTLDSPHLVVDRLWQAGEFAARIR